MTNHLQTTAAARTARMRKAMAWATGALVVATALTPVPARAGFSDLLMALDASERAIESASPTSRVLARWDIPGSAIPDLERAELASTPFSSRARRFGPGESLQFLSLAYVPRVEGESAIQPFASNFLSESAFRVNAMVPRLMEGLQSPPALAKADPPVQTLSEVVKAALPVGRPTRTALDETICSLNVVDWSLSKVLQALSLQTQANLLLQAPEDTKLTISLNNVPLIDMLRHITAVTNLRFLKVENTYVIADGARLSKSYPDEWAIAHPGDAVVEPVKAVVVTRVYITNYVKSSQMADTLTAIFKEQGLSVTGGPAQTSPKIESRDSASVTGVTVGTVATSTSADGLSRLVVLRGPESVVLSAIEVAKSLDVARAQVAIAVSIHDITNDAVKELGMSWTFGDVAISETPGKGLNLGAFNRAPQNFSAMISALEKSDRAKLLANPSVSVQDGEQAFILIGNKINYPVLIGYTQLNTPIFDKETEKVGIYLQVAASVSSDNAITLSLYPQVSTITGFLQVNGASYPQIATREAQTTLRVQTGETIVMGGLLRDEEISNMEKVPLLGDIPILGELFKRRKKTKTSSQVLIAITPVVIPPQEK